MPLKKGSSRSAVSRNIREIVHSWEDSGRIGTSHPESKKKAVKQATVIALQKAGKSKYQKGSASKSGAARRSAS